MAHSDCATTGYEKGCETLGESWTPRQIGGAPIAVRGTCSETEGTLRRGKGLRPGFSIGDRHDAVC